MIVHLGCRLFGPADTGMIADSASQNRHMKTPRSQDIDRGAQQRQPLFVS